SSPLPELSPVSLHDALPICPYTQGGGLGRAMQPGVEVWQASQTNGTDQCEGAAQHKQGRNDVLGKLAHENFLRPGYSITLPRFRYLAMATVPTKPMTAISRAASRYMRVPRVMPSRMMSAMALMYRVSSASTRSGASGPLISRYTLSSAAIMTMAIVR